MKFIKKLTDMIDRTNEDYVDDDNDNGYYADEEDNNIDSGRTDISSGSSDSYSDVTSASRPSSQPVANLVSLRSSSRTPVVLKKLDEYGDEIQGVADILNEKKIVILNLETCPADNSRRVIDFMSGVAYANSGSIKKIAGKAYIITPDSVPLSGDQLEDLSNLNESYFD